MKLRGEALALAMALNSSDETTLGPTDSALCAEALRYYAQSRIPFNRSLRVASVIGAVLVGAAVTSLGVEGDAPRLVSQVSAPISSPTATATATATAFTAVADSGSIRR